MVTYGNLLKGVNKMNEKIPKKIHYCWFGGNPLPKLAIECIESWKKNCPDYEIIEWNEQNFDLSMFNYAQEAYNSKKYAFVSDVCRLYALYNHGGIYMDTDVEVIQSLDEFLCHNSFSGFETINSVPTGIMACQKNDKLFKEFLDYYNDKRFIKTDGSLDLTTNIIPITNILLKYNLELNNQFQIINGMALYPKTYFCPLNYDSEKTEFSNKTYTIHHFAGSWLSSKERKKLKGKNLGSRIRRLIKKIIKEKNYYKLKKLIKGKKI